MPLQFLPELKRRLRHISYLKYLLTLLNWDQEVCMPKAGVEIRSDVLAYLTGLLHEEWTSKELEQQILALKEQYDRMELSPTLASIVREVHREWIRENKLPKDFVKEYARTTSAALESWKEARKQAEFGIFAPNLEKILILKRREAKYLAYKGSPYNALLDISEPETSVEEMTALFSEIKAFLIPFIQKIMKSSVKTNPKRLRGNFPLEKQHAFNRMIAEKIGYDFSRGRLDESEHPFKSEMHPTDVRTTTNYDERDVWFALDSTLHEVGHALYDQGQKIEAFGTPLGEALFYGFHESQSRLWENMFGRSKAFWRYFAPKLEKTFPEPFANMPLDELYKNINHVSPSLIRMEADEVTYTLHLAIRFEIEKDLIEDRLETTDVPRVWNDKMKEYLGINVPNDAAGALQDGQWADGLLGDLPTYVFGNLYSAQMYDAMRQDIPQLDHVISQGNFEVPLAWLRKHVYSLGRFYPPRELIKKISGSPLSAIPFMEYIEKKYSEIYEL